MTAVETSTRTAAGCFYVGRNFRTDNGAVVVFSQKKLNGVWQPPFVSIYDLTLIESLRLYANQRYRPDGVW